MVAIPTNYKMGTGLAATIMGQQAGLEAEQTGLANLVKGMQMPAEALKGQEAAMLMQNPEYLQQKVQNTMIDLRNQYSAADFQQTLNSANRIGIELDAAGGDPAKEQQVVDKALTALKIDPQSEFAQYARRDPRGALTKFKQGVEASMIGAQGGKHLADMEKERFVQGEHWKRTQAEIEGRNRNAQISAGAADSRIIAQEQREIKKARRALAFKDPVELEQGLNSALNNGIDPVTMEPLTPETRKYYETMRDAATNAVAKKQKTINFNFGDGTSTSATPAPAVRKPSSAADEAASKGF